MLCPKCGSISFDNLTVCSKCQHDLSAVQAQLRGTAIQGETCFFLASALSAGDADDSAEYIDLSDTAAPDTNTEAHVPEQEETPAEQTVGLEDIPAPELAATVTAPNNSATLELAEKKIIVPPARKDAESAESLASLGEKTQTGNIAPSADTESLILKINDAEQDSPNKSRDNGQIPIDLEQIDLSDLLHPPQQTPPPAPETKNRATHQDNNDDYLPGLSAESSASTTGSEFDFDDLTLEKVVPANEQGNKSDDIDPEADKTNAQSSKS